jgi:hypothetical protein
MIDTWDLSAQRAAASRERAEVVHALLARFAAWLRSAFASAPTIRAPQARGRECFGTEC